jgi:hypothetical protein
MRDAKRSGWRTERARRSLNSPFGSKPTSSANRQNSRCTRKCAAWCGSTSRACRLADRWPKRSAASYMTASGVVSGRSKFGSVQRLQDCQVL